MRDARDYWAASFAKPPFVGEIVIRHRQPRFGQDRLDVNSCQGAIVLDSSVRGIADCYCPQLVVLIACVDD